MVVAAVVLGMVLAIVPLMVIRLLRPVVLIRLAALPSERIGAHATVPEIYLCEVEAGIHGRPAVDIDERIKGTWQITPEDEELQQRFWSLWRPGQGRHGRLFRARIGAEFCGRAGSY